MEMVRAKQQEEYGGNYEDLQKSLSGYAKQLTGSDLASMVCHQWFVFHAFVE